MDEVLLASRSQRSGQSITVDYLTRDLWARGRLLSEFRNGLKKKGVLNHFTRVQLGSLDPNSGGRLLVSLESIGFMLKVKRSN